MSQKVEHPTFSYWNNPLQDFLVMETNPQTHTELLHIVLKTLGNTGVNVLGKEHCVNENKYNIGQHTMGFLLCHASPNYLSGMLIPLKKP